MIAWLFALETLAVPPDPAEICPHPISLQQLADDLAAAESGYLSLSPDQFADAADLVVLDLPCVSAPVPAEMAARYHIVMGLLWYMRGEQVHARASLAAARAADASFAVSSVLVPEGHELRGFLERAPPSETAFVPQLVSGTLLFDGQASNERPTERPTILQLVDEGGHAATCYLLPDDAMPSYIQPPPPLDAPLRPVRARKWRWATLGGIGVVASTSLYALAASSASRFSGPLPETFGRDDLSALRTRTNLLVIGSLVSASAGAVGIAGVALPARDERP